MLGDGMVPLPCGRLSGLRTPEPPVLKQSGLSAVALAKVESTVTCPRVLPAGEQGSRKIPHSPAASPPGPEPRGRRVGIKKNLWAIWLTGSSKNTILEGKEYGGISRRTD